MTVEIYTTPSCVHCVGAKRLFDRHGIDYQEIDVANAPDKLQEMIERSGGRTVPQIFIEQQLVGGHDQLRQLLEAKQAA